MANVSHFYAHESCGKCTPCREGTRWFRQIHDRIAAGWGRQEDLDILIDICDGVEMKSFCPLGDAAAWPVRSAVTRFREDYERAIANSKAPHGDVQDEAYEGHKRTEERVKTVTLTAM